MTVAATSTRRAWALTRDGDVISLLPLDPGPGQTPRTLLTARGASLIADDTTSNAISHAAYVRR